MCQEALQAGSSHATSRSSQSKQVQNELSATNLQTGFSDVLQNSQHKTDSDTLVTDIFMLLFNSGLLHPTHAFCTFNNFLKRYGLVLSSKVIVLSQEQHTMTFLHEVMYFVRPDCNVHISVLQDTVRMDSTMHV